MNNNTSSDNNDDSVRLLDPYNLSDELQLADILFVAGEGSLDFTLSQFG